jgi:hypothetical protein
MDYPEVDNKKVQKIAIFAGVGLLFLLFIVFAIMSQVSRGNSSTANSTVTPTLPVNQGGSDFIGQQNNNTTREGSSNTKLYIDPTDGVKSTVKAPVPGAAAKVGEEIIYNVDINRELAALPNSDDPTTIRNVFNKIVNDSVTLQGAAKEGLIKLDPTTYNTNTKDYKKRIALVAQAKNSIAKTVDSYSGSFVSLWFHNQKPGKVGYAKGKQIAYSKIKPLYDQVKAGKMTMLQASDEIIADDTLFDVDEAFKVNSYGEYQATQEEAPTFNPSFNTILSNLKTGEVSQLYTAKDLDEKGNLIDAVYIFGKADKIITGKGYSSYDEWLELQKEKYEVTQY